MPAAANPLSRPCTAFDGARLLAAGALVDVALAVRAALERDATKSILVFDDQTGRVVDLDLRGATAEIVERPRRHPTAPAPDADAPRSRGRPKLGVVAREVTLLPRHWEWLAGEPGGASAALRKLVEEARRSGGAKQQRRAAQEAAYKFMEAMAGDLPGFEEGVRALFADDEARLQSHIARWPGDVRKYTLKLVFAART
jgi:hypothetical protein